MRLGQYAGFVANAEAPAVYFERVKRLRPGDAGAWFAAGVEAQRRGDGPAARANWSQALDLDPRFLSQVLRAAGPNVPVLDLVPESVGALALAADALFPDRRRDRDARLPYLRRAAAIDPQRLNQVERKLRADAFAELGDAARAQEAWRLALAADPESAWVRERFAAWLEGEELYAEALEQLEWLQTHARAAPNLRDRVDAAEHALRLQAQIERP